MLGQLGFKTVHLERLTPSEQVSATLHAKVIVGNHGGGLPAMIYAPEGCRVLELRSKDDDFHNCYYSLASCLNLPYSYLLCEPVDRSKGFDSDLFVDVGKLQRLLLSILNEVSFSSGDNRCDGPPEAFSCSI
jgi:hypothetical protein